VALKAERNADYAAAAVSTLGRLARRHGLEAPTHVHHTSGATKGQKQLVAALAITVERQKRISELEASLATFTKEPARLDRRSGVRAAE
jgi:hypothetical protein